MSEKLKHGFEHGDYNLSVVIFRFVHLQRCFFWELAKEHNITPLQIQILFSLCFMPDTANTITALADLLRRPKPPVSESFFGLEQKGFVKREQHPTDRRSYLLSVTQQGTDLCVQGFSYFKMLRGQFQQLPAEELLRVCRSLVKILYSLYAQGSLRFINACFSCDFADGFQDDGAFYCRVYKKDYHWEDVEFRCPWQKNNGVASEAPVPSCQKELEIDKSAALAMMRFSDFEWIIFGELAKQYKISPIQFHMMVMLRYFPDRVNTISNFARLLCVSKPAISEAVTYMVRRGLLIREARQGDRRYRVLQLTAKGRGLAEKVLGYHQQVVNHLQVLSVEDRTQLYASLLHLIEMMSRSGIVSGVWICNTCRFFERNSDSGLHYCSHFDKQMSDRELEAFCLDYRSSSDTVDRLLQGAYTGLGK